MDIHRIVNTFFTSNSWVIDFGATAWIVDCGDVEPILKIISNKQLAGVFLTHAHFDHIYGLNELLKVFPSTTIYTNMVGREMLVDDRKNMSRYHETPFIFEHPNNIRIINGGDEIDLGEECILKVIATPGHNDSCLSFATDKQIFTGDSYIPGEKVVTNLPGGNKAKAKESLNHIKHLAFGRTIYPGHGECENR